MGPGDWTNVGLACSSSLIDGLDPVDPDSTGFS